MKKEGWFRLYTSILDPLDKTHSLSDRVYRHWTYILAAYKRNGGIMPDLQALGSYLSLSPLAAERLMAALEAADLLDRDKGYWEPHDWDSLQYESDVSTKRVRAFRERKKKRLETVSGYAMKPFHETESPSVRNRVSEKTEKTEKEVQEICEVGVGVVAPLAAANGHPPPIQASNEKLPADVVDRIHKIADTYPTNDGYEEGCRILLQRLQSDAHPLRTLAAFEANAPLWIAEIIAGNSARKPWFWFIQNNNWLRLPKIQPQRKLSDPKLDAARAQRAAKREAPK